MESVNENGRGFSRANLCRRSIEDYSRNLRFLRPLFHCDAAENNFPSLQMNLKVQRRVLMEIRAGLCNHALGKHFSLSPIPFSFIRIPVYHEQQHASAVVQSGAHLLAAISNLPHFPPFRLPSFRMPLFSSICSSLAFDRRSNREY